MLDLPDHGYTDYQLGKIDPGGNVDPILGGEATTIDRPGYRYVLQIAIPAIPSASDARIFQSMLEQGAREDVSYPFPLDFKPAPAGTPVVNGASPAGAVIPIRGLAANYQFKAGQPVAVVSGGVRSIHKATAAQSASGTGTITLNVFPYTRKAFADGDTVEVANPRIGGILTWDGAAQSSFGSRPFTITITER
jgi:hypothetical protein